jgi:hypothetical protein
MAAALKKVVVRTFADELAWGYLPQGGFVHSAGIDLMAVDGRLTTFVVENIKTISYVRDFNLDDSLLPERLSRKSFSARPRGDGLWIRLTFHDDDTLEGLASVDISFLDSLLVDLGIFMKPPDARANTQRVFVPRSALRSFEILGFIAAPSRRAAQSPPRKATTDVQTSLFGE